MLFIKDLKIVNFRCFDSYNLQLKPNINILIGDNGSGKTSIVEAISYLCLGKSFKNAKDKDVLNVDADYFTVVSNISCDNEENRTVISYDGTYKRVKNGEVLCKTLSEYVGKYKLISFSPDDLSIIKGGPINRRRFIDMFISQCDNKYLKVLVEYKKLLKMRNDFLKNTNGKQYDKILFDVITDNIIKCGKLIISAREKYINILNTYIKDISSRLTNQKEVIKISYIPNSDVNNYEINMKRSINYDFLTKTTNFGPQKDNLEIKMMDKNAAIYASQGQCRLAVLCMKLAIYEVFSKIDNNIIIILDDVFSELDQNRQNYLLEYIKKTSQVFITTTDIYKLPEKIINDSNIIKIGGNYNG